MRRVLVAGAVGLGLGGFGARRTANDAEGDADPGSDANAAGDADDGGSSAPDAADNAPSTEPVRRPEPVLVSASDYRAGIAFRPVDRLPRRAVTAVLGGRLDDYEPVVPDSTDYEGYVVDYRPHPPGKYAFAFADGRTLRTDRRYRLTDDVVFFDARMNLVSASVATVHDADGESTASNSSTTDAATPAVVLGTTETDDAG